MKPFESIGEFFFWARQNAQGRVSAILRVYTPDGSGSADFEVRWLPTVPSQVFTGRLL